MQLRGAATSDQTRHLNMIQTHHNTNRIIAACAENIGTFQDDNVDCAAAQNET